MLDMVGDSQKIEGISESSADLSDPLRPYSLKGHTARLEREQTAQVKILGGVALAGQATVFYAAPNTGKTLITMALLKAAVEKGAVNPCRVYYINMDDTSSGLVEKNRLADSGGYHMLADGHKDFKAKDFRLAMVEMTNDDSARGCVVIIDTLKKFVNTMDKTMSSDFAGVMRRFTLKGGTLIALAHTNKNLDSNGKAKYSGTSDIVDDLDCAYTLSEIPLVSDGSLKAVEFVNIKKRGDVAKHAVYSYSARDGISYADLVNSVVEVDQAKIEFWRLSAELDKDAESIDVVSNCILEGVVSKMTLVKEVASRLRIGQGAASNLINRYTGTDQAVHRWNFTVGNRGVRTYSLLSKSVVDDSDDY